jgi:hypothetical protein
MLDKFITTNRGSSAWFATSAGIFQGIISRNEIEAERDVVILSGSFYFTGNIRLSVGEITIIRKTVVAWGTSNPSYQNTFD